jgi:glyoxylase-like metal-dependent hydrolase (beta-lactamase superfamily II)
VARPQQRNPAGAPGDWYVDTVCFDCDAARHVAPGLIGTDAQGKSIFLRQPESDKELEMAWLAVEVCPTRSVGNLRIRRPPSPPFPQDLGDGVFRLGHNAESSFGAHSYLVVRPAGNLMVDAPRWTRSVFEPIEARGGLSDILLTHRDDVADARRYAERFGARVWIHADDADAAPYATDLLHGTGAHEIRDGVTAIPVPGHTRGSVLYLVDEHLLFSGDSLAWSPQRATLTAFRNACWFSWPEQQRSLARLADSERRFDRLLCGHGWSHDAPADEMHAHLVALTERMVERS